MAAPVYGGHDIRHGQFLSYYSFTKSHMLIEVGPVNKIDTVIDPGFFSCGISGPFSF